MTATTTERPKRLIWGFGPNVEFPAPTDDEFKSVGELFLPAERLEKVGLALIADRQNLASLRRFHIAYRWRRGGSRTPRGDVHSKAVILPAASRHVSGVDAVVWVSANFVRTLKVDNWTVEAMLFETLCSIGMNDAGGPAQRYPDFDGYYASIAHYGPRRYQLQRLQEALAPQQGTLPLFDDDDDDEDGGE